MMTTRIGYAKAKRNERYLDPELVHDLQNRLHCLEGHIRGIERMLDEQAACEELLIQTSAVRAALNQITLKILEGQMRAYSTDWVTEDEESVAFDKIRSALAQILKMA